jgi:hypothetical protein
MTTYPIELDASVALEVCVLLQRYIRWFTPEQSTVSVVYIQSLDQVKIRNIVQSVLTEQGVRLREDAPLEGLVEFQQVLVVWRVVCTGQSEAMTWVQETIVRVRRMMTERGDPGPFSEYLRDPRGNPLGEHEM